MSERSMPRWGVPARCVVWPGYRVDASTEWETGQDCRIFDVAEFSALMRLALAADDIAHVVEDDSMGEDEEWHAIVQEFRAALGAVWPTGEDDHE